MKNPDKIKNNNPFRVPENYFAEVNKRILSATAGKEGSKKTFFINRFRPVMAVAASVTGFILIMFIAMKLLSPGNDFQIISDSGNKSELYFEDIDLLTLERNAESTVVFEEGSGASKKEIIDYLLLEDIEIAEIYEQL